MEHSPQTGSAYQVVGNPGSANIICLQRKIISYRNTWEENLLRCVCLVRETETIPPIAGGLLFPKPSPLGCIEADDGHKASVAKYLGTGAVAGLGLCC